MSSLDALAPASGDAEQRAIGRSLVWHGALLVLLGLLSGFTPELSAAPRAALSAHLIGVTQGTLLFAVAGAWHWLRASTRLLRAVKVSLLVGLYANWVGAQLAAFTGGGRGMFTVSGARMPDVAAAWADWAVTALLGASAVVILSCALLLWASRRSAPGEAQGDA